MENAVQEIDYLKMLEQSKEFIVNSTFAVVNLFP